MDGVSMSSFDDAATTPHEAPQGPRPCAPGDPQHEELKALVAAHATADGCAEALHPGLHFYRVSRPMTFRKTRTPGPTFTAVVQGRKVARIGDVELPYDPCRYLVITGEVDFEGSVLEASRDRPYLAVSLDIPADVVAKTLLALAEEDAPELEESVPAFVGGLDASIKSVVIRMLRAIDDPLERRFVVPLVIEELVFRLLRCEAAAVVRTAVRRDRDAEAIARAMHFMRSNAARSLTVEAVARHVAMSPSHFAHRFRAVARVSPMRYLKHVRMSDARELMIATGLRVAEAASRVGYESPSHFTRDFRSHFGAAPAEYVRRFRRS
jgi:AraC-like DNA-binding protein